MRVKIGRAPVISDAEVGFGVSRSSMGEVAQETICCVMKCNAFELTLYLFTVFSRACNA